MQWNAVCVFPDHGSEVNRTFKNSNALNIDRYALLTNSFYHQKAWGITVLKQTCIYHVEIKRTDRNNLALNCVLAFERFFWICLASSIKNVTTAFSAQHFTTLVIEYRLQKKVKKKEDRETMIVLPSYFVLKLKLNLNFLPVERMRTNVSIDGTQRQEGVFSRPTVRKSLKMAKLLVKTNCCWGRVLSKKYGD